MSIFGKLKKIINNDTITKVKVAGSLAGLILTGKGGKVLEKIDSASDVALDSLAILEKAKNLLKK